MGTNDIWHQRPQSFIKAFSLLENAVELYNRQGGLSDLEEQWLIQRFEFTHELAWNICKDYEAKINTLVYQLYKLTEAEIKLIENE